MPPLHTVISPRGTRIEATIHDLLQSAAGQPSSREAAASRWEAFAAGVTQARAESEQAAVPAANSTMREERQAQ